MAKVKKKCATKKRSESSLDSTFFVSFVGEYVDVISKFLSGSTKSTLTGVISGFLLDLDDKFYYLSDDGQTVSRAIKSEDVMAIEIVQQKTIHDIALEQLEIVDRNDAN
jgi:hypothetical protein